MEITEYKNIYDNEKAHFFYVSTHSLILRLIKKYTKKRGLKILDAGCGTGLLSKKLKVFGDVVAMDLSPEALRLAKNRGLKVKKASIEKIPFKDNYFDLVVSVDVLTAKSIKNDLVPLSEFYRVLKPEGILFLRVSAIKSLRLQHDKHVHMRQRYSKGELYRKLLKVGFLIEKLSFVNFSLFPFILVRNFWEKIIKPKDTASSIKEVNPLINLLFSKVLLFEALLLKKIDLPIGIGLIAVCKKAGKNSLTNPPPQKKNLLDKYKKLKAIIAVLIILVTVIFIMRILLNHYEQVGDSFLFISPAKVLISSIFFLGYLYMRALSWRSIVHSLGSPINKKEGLSIWFISEATRYIPGNIWSFISRSYMVRQKHLTLKASILILPIEIITIILTTFVLSSYAIFRTTERLPADIFIYITLAALLATTLGIFILHRKIRQTLKYLSNQQIDIGNLLLSFVFQLISWTLYGIGTIVLINNPLNGDILLLFSSSLLAWLIGYLSIITPMGLGVRESSFVFLTATQIGLTQAAFIAVLHRLILTVAELANLVFWVIVSRFSQKKEKMF